MDAFMGCKQVGRQAWLCRALYNQIRRGRLRPIGATLYMSNIPSVFYFSIPFSPASRLGRALRDRPYLQELLKLTWIYSTLYIYFVIIRNLQTITSSHNTRSPQRNHHPRRPQPLHGASSKPQRPLDLRRRRAAGPQAQHLAQRPHIHELPPRPLPLRPRAPVRELSLGVGALPQPAPRL